MHTSRFSFPVFIIISVIYLICSLLFLDEATFWLKPFLVPPLLLFTFSSYSFPLKQWLFLALTFSWMGDVLLLFVFKDGLFFIFGLSAFLVAHIFYIILFHKEIRRSGSFIRLHWPALTTVIFLFITFYGLLAPHLGELKVPVMAYAAVILFMLYLTWLLHTHRKDQFSTAIFTGALAFVLSDFLLAINKFWIPIPNAGFFIMVTYLYAQGAIVWGCLGRGE